MHKDNFRKHSVLIGENGSGCLFQPLDSDATYILTAKHLFYDEKDEGRGVESIQFADGTEIEIYRCLQTQDGWDNQKTPFTFIEFETYFPHPHKDCDAAILKISPALEEYDRIYIDADLKLPELYELCGFPSNVTGIQRLYTPHKLENFLGSNNFFDGARLSYTLSKKEIEGMSGGGILRLSDDYISILGIQSKMGQQLFAAGEIGFVPMKYFKEIVTNEKYSSKLSPLHPPYLSSFSFLLDDIFKLDSAVYELDKQDKLTKILKSKANSIKESDITPLEIKEHLKDRLLLIDQSSNDLEQKAIWAIWFELLTILNIAKDNNLTKDDLPRVFEKIRMFYSNKPSDFWVNHLHELHLVDYTGLQDDGLVVVASDQKANGMHILDLKKVNTHIAKAREEFELTYIDDPSEFPFDKYKFANISFFKESTVSEVNDSFMTNNIKDCITMLRDLYERLIPNW